MIRFKTNQKELEREFRKVLKTVEQGTNRAAKEARTEAHVAAISYLIASVYGTVPGNVYQRTERALNSIGVTLVPTKDGFLLTVANDAPYGSQIELGNELSYQEQTSSDSQIPQISADELAEMMEDYGAATDGNLSADQVHDLFERTGQNPYVPGPHITPAAIVGLYAFMRRLDAVWKQAGAT